MKEKLLLAYYIGKAIVHNERNQSQYLVGIIDALGWVLDEDEDKEIPKFFYDENE